MSRIPKDRRWRATDDAVNMSIAAARAAEDAHRHASRHAYPIAGDDPAALLQLAAQKWGTAADLAMTAATAWRELATAARPDTIPAALRAGRDVLAAPLADEWADDASRALHAALD